MQPSVSHKLEWDVVITWTIYVFMHCRCEPQQIHGIVQATAIASCMSRTANLYQSELVPCPPDLSAAFICGYSVNGVLRICVCLMYVYMCGLCVGVMLLFIT